jgi:hypothetical protein
MAQNAAVALNSKGFSIQQRTRRRESIAFTSEGTRLQMARAVLLQIPFKVLP